MDYRNKKTSATISDSEYQKLSNEEKANYEKKADDSPIDDGSSTNQVTSDCANAGSFSTFFGGGIF